MHTYVTVRVLLILIANMNMIGTLSSRIAFCMQMTATGQYGLKCYLTFDSRNGPLEGL